MYCQTETLVFSLFRGCARRVAADKLPSPGLPGWLRRQAARTEIQIVSDAMDSKQTTEAPPFPLRACPTPQYSQSKTQTRLFPLRISAIWPIVTE
jgi:hypothetical protein